MEFEYIIYYNVWLKCISCGEAMPGILSYDVRECCEYPCGGSSLIAEAELETIENHTMDKVA